MKNSFISILFLLFTCTLYSQTIGANGEGLTEKYIPSDVGLIKSLGHMAVRFPGGATGKDAYCRLNAVGFGFRLDSMNVWAAKYGTDENGEEYAEQIAREYSQDQAEDRSYLYDMAEIQLATGCDIIWQINLFANAQENIASINDYLSIRFADHPSWKPTIAYFVLGNELYFLDLTGDGKNMDGAAYVTLCIPQIDPLRNAFPDIKIAFDYAQDVTTNKFHRLFNDHPEAYIKNNPGKIAGIDSHPYLNSDIAVASSLHPSFIAGSKDIKKIAYSSAFNQLLHDTYAKYNTIWPVTKYYRNLIDTVRKSLPGTELLTTEWQSLPIPLYGDVISNAAYMYFTFTTYRVDFKYFLAQNLLGSYDFAMISDHSMSAKAYALKLANELPVTGWSDVPADGRLIITEPGTYYYRSINMTDIDKTFTVVYSEEYEVENHYLWGLENYSAMGNAGFYLNNPPQATDVFYVESTGMEIKENSFGVIKIIAKEKPCDQLTFWLDADADGYGNAAQVEYGCELVFGYVFNDNDCNDNDASIHPNTAEVCNYLDDNCNGAIDEGIVYGVYYPDEDGDSYGGPQGTIGCTKPDGYVLTNTDCNDANGSVHPGATEICGNGIDEDCNGSDLECAPVVCYKRVLGIFCFLDKPCKKNNCTK